MEGSHDSFLRKETLLVLLKGYTACLSFYSEDRVTPDDDKSIVEEKMADSVAVKAGRVQQVCIHVSHRNAVSTYTALGHTGEGLNLCFTVPVGHIILCRVSIRREFSTYRASERGAKI